MHNRLVEQHPFIAVPPLPEKQVQGRFQADLWRSGAAGWKSTSTTSRGTRSCAAATSSATSSAPPSTNWKEGKRIIEAEPAGVAAFLDRISVPAAPLPPDPCA